MSNRGNFIENEAAYDAAIDRRIKNNARTGRARRWIAAHADAQRLNDWLNENGEFARQCDDQGIWKNHPAAPRGAFYAKLAASLREWGGLTDGQTEAARAGLQKALDQAEGREAAKDAQREIDLRSVHVAVVGARSDFEAAVEFATSYETAFGTSYIYGLRDAGGNVLIIKGSAPVGVRVECGFDPIRKGQTIKFPAFVKSHGDRNGIKQTILNRVKIKEVLGG